MQARQVFDELSQGFDELYGAGADAPLLAAWAPGRCELAGNHTDHQGGHVIATAVDRYVRGLFRANGANRIRLASEGFEPVEIDLEDLSPRPGEKGGSAGLVRGLAAQFVGRGCEPAGFDALLASDVAPGSGISSSAAFELCLASAMNAIWAAGSLKPADLALMSQMAERDWFGKPCGLMDQMAVALGGINAFDFSPSGLPLTSRIDFDFCDSGHKLVLVNVGEDHSASIDDYAAVPAEMCAVARMLGASRLCEVDQSEFLARIGEVRAALGDRAALRAMGFWREERYTAQRRDALLRHDVSGFCELTRLSGANSAMFLQNASSGVTEQPTLVALSIAEDFLRGEGAERVHGGGFGGTIMCVVPKGKLDAFVSAMDGAMGEGSCGVYQTVEEGATAQWM